MPGAADVLFLVGLFYDLGNLWVVFQGFEKTVDVDRAPALGKSNVLLRCEILAAKKDHRIAAEGIF